jgi:hypothetical protein
MPTEPSSTPVRSKAPTPKLISSYRKIRDQVKVANEDFKAFKNKAEAAMELIGLELAARLEEQGLENFKCKGIGTAFYSLKEFVSVTEWDDTMRFVMEDVISKAKLDKDGHITNLDSLMNNSNIKYISKGISKADTIKYLEDNKRVLPGSKYDSEKVIQVRK